MMRWIYAGAASVVLIAAGIVHGFWTDRWASPAIVKEKAELLNDVPLQIGDWTGTEIAVKPGQAGPGVTGCIQRSYYHRQRGVTIVLALVNGRPGPVAIHTPEACYGASGYEVGTRAEVDLDKNDRFAHFWKADAVRKKVSTEERLRIYWAWNGGDGWKASTDARSEFPRHRYPVLHKLYILRDLNSTADLGKDEPCEAFLKELLPVLDRTLFQ
jgi:hypothetical protein